MSNKTKSPPHIEAYTKRLASSLNKTLDPDRDPCVARLTEVIRYQQYLNDDSRIDLTRTLEIVAERARCFASQLDGKHDA